MCPAHEYQKIYGARRRRRERRKTRSLKCKIVRNVSQAWHGIGGFLSTGVRIITRHKNWQRQEIKNLAQGH